MNEHSKYYPLPDETLPGLDVSQHYEDLVALRDLLQNRGIDTRNSRIDRYLQYYEEVTDRGVVDPSRFFKNALPGPFESRIDWLLYILREVHELTWILKGLQSRPPDGVDSKLLEIISGRDFAALDSDTHARNTQFELRIASYFCQAGCEVDLSTGTDVIALTEKFAYFVECKRVSSAKQLSRRLSKARRQLRKRMPSKYLDRTAIGTIAVDVTQIAFSHNGLTWAVTDDHSRDIIQEKLVSVVDHADRNVVFDGHKGLIGYWFQIHIASLVMNPPTPLTRFSSYHVFKNLKRRKERKAAREFRQMFESVSEIDERSEPPKKLHRRTELVFPSGTKFNLDDSRIVELLDKSDTSEEALSEVIGTLLMPDQEHEFYYFDVCMIDSSFLTKWRESLEEEPIHSKLRLLAAMYALRYPYEPDGNA